jgi:hypothetical protein
LGLLPCFYEFPSVGFSICVSLCIVLNPFAPGLSLEHILGGQFGCAQRLVGSDGQCSLCHGYTPLAKSRAIEYNTGSESEWECLSIVFTSTYYNYA